MVPFTEVLVSFHDTLGGVGEAVELLISLTKVDVSKVLSVGATEEIGNGQLLSVELLEIVVSILVALVLLTVVLSTDVVVTVVLLSVVVVDDDDAVGDNVVSEATVVIIGFDVVSGLAVVGSGVVVSGTIGSTLEPGALIGDTVSVGTNVVVDTVSGGTNVVVEDDGWLDSVVSGESVSKLVDDSVLNSISGSGLV